MYVRPSLFSLFVFHLCVLFILLLDCFAVCKCFCCARANRSAVCDTDVGSGDGGGGGSGGVASRCTISSSLCVSTLSHSTQFSVHFSSVFFFFTMSFTFTSLFADWISPLGLFTHSMCVSFSLAPSSGIVFFVSVRLIMYPFVNCVCYYGLKALTEYREMSKPRVVTETTGLLFSFSFNCLCCYILFIGNSFACLLFFICFGSIPFILVFSVCAVAS